MAHYNYYKNKLSANRLRQCYDLATVEVKEYLDAELKYVQSWLPEKGLILELGCGYGRVLKQLYTDQHQLIGVDNAPESLYAGIDYLAQDDLKKPMATLAAMNALVLGFPDSCFDLVLCIQNGLSAFGVDKRELIHEALRVTKPGGRALFSSYSPNFWEQRLIWFELQAKAGLLGDIDREATGNGVIACTDGFRSTTIVKEEFIDLTSHLKNRREITEVAGSSVFCNIEAPV